MELTLQFIRRKKYNSGTWQEVAGEINQDFVEYVKNNNLLLYNYFSSSELIIYDYVKGPVDFIHLCATMNGVIVGGDLSIKSIIVGSTHVRNLCGWAGDLQSLVVDTYLLTTKDDYQVFFDKFYSIMGCDDYSFSMADLLADIDAYNFSNNWISSYWQSNLFGSACRYYYENIDIPGTGWNSRSNLRFSQFLEGETRRSFSNTVGEYTKQNWLLGVEWPLYESLAIQRNIKLELTDNHSKAAKDAFVDYIWCLYEAEL